MLHLYFSNRYETLSRLLIERLGTGVGGVFTPAQVIVPSRSVERSLTLAIADHDGICANVRFEYLARWLWRQISLLVKGVGETSPFEAEVLSWRIYRALGDPQFVNEHARLHAYLRGADDLMRYELSQALAALIRDYSTYREDWLDAWADGSSIDPLPKHPDPTVAQHALADERWQAALYRRIIAELKVDARHPGLAFIKEIRSKGVAFAIEAGLPACVHLFVLPTMPPQHMRLVQLLGSLIEVQLYVINPCQEYWFEVVEPRRLQALAAQGRDQYHEIGHPLLASWGRQAQSHIGLLANLEGPGVSDVELYESHDGDSALAQLQNSILLMSSLEEGALSILADDRSIEVHDCHSLTRELEVLQDYLLDLFVSDPDLRPSDVLVVTPDLEAAAPVIEAVFGTVAQERNIPFQLTGRSRSTVNAPARTLLALLSLAASRCEATAVFDLLQQPLVARRFELCDEDLQLIRGWITAAGFHWALDGEHYRELDFPGEARYTLSDGLERLFLGYALPDTLAEPLFGKILPAGQASGSNALALGAFWRFAGALRDFQAIASVPRNIEAWARDLTAAVAAFMDANAAELDDLDDLLITIDRLADIVQLGGFGEALPLSVVHAALEGLMDEAIHGGVPTGRVTFTSMAALRNLPFEAVCVIGLNDGAFPTSLRAPEYDLMALDPRRGDRQRSLDERNLFLDLVLAARRRLYLSYCGRSVRDNSTLPPSVLVAELLAVMQLDAYQHPLQAFAEQSFSTQTKRALRSFNREMGEAVRESLVAAGSDRALELADDGDEEGEEADEEAEEAMTDVQQPRFFTAPLAAAGAEWRTLTLEQLANFFRNPSRYLLKSRMEIDLGNEPDELQDLEPFVLDSQGRRALAARVLPGLIENPDDPAAAGLLAATTELPNGNLGEIERARELASLREFAGRVRAHSHAPILAPHHASLRLDVDGEPWQVSAAYSDLRPQGLVRWRYSQQRDFDALPAVDAIDAWIRHLLLCADAPLNVATRTIAIARNGTWVFQAPDDPGGLLRSLLAIYRRGINEPTPFFPRSAWRYCHEGYRMTEARKEWRKNEYKPYAESADPANVLAFRGQPEPLGEEFRRLARAVYDPLIAHVVKMASGP